MFFFLVKSTLFLFLFWGVYKLFLERENIYSANRFYLLCSLLLCGTLPFISLPEFSPKQGLVSEILRPEASPAQTSPLAATTTEEVPFIAPEPILQKRSDANEIAALETVSSPARKSWIFWVGVIYLFGVIIFTIRFLAQIGQILWWMVKNTSQTLALPSYRLVYHPSIQDPCSFFHYIFINPDLYSYETYEQIVAHEEMHVDQKHSLDLVLAELFVIIFWFNPIAWFMRADIENNLEFQTDQLLLQKNKVEKQTYQLNLLKVAIVKAPLSLTTNYNQSLVQKRIMKMNVKNAQSKAYWKYALLAPLILLSVLLINEPVKAIPLSDAYNPSEIWEALQAEPLVPAPPLQPSETPTEAIDQASSGAQQAETPLGELAEDCYDLLKAIQAEDIAGVKKLLQSTEADCISKKDIYITYETKRHIFRTSLPRTPIGAAAYVGNLEIAKLLLAQNAKIDGRSNRDAFPIMIAAGQGHLDFVQFCIAQGEDVNKYLEREGTALLFAARGGYLEVVEYLVTNGASIPRRVPGEGTAITVAARGGHTSTVAYLLKQGADMNRVVSGEGTPLSLAARGGHTQTVKFLLDQGADMEQVVRGEGTALSLAARGGHLETVQFLLKNGAQINRVVRGEGTPLSLAARGGHTQTAEYLIDQGADINQVIPGEGTPLSLAARGGHTQTVKFFLDKGADINKPVAGEGTPLSLAARGGHTQTVKFLLDQGADMEQVVRGEGTALSLAARGGHTSTVKYLLERGAEMDKAIRGEGTALSLAARGGHLSTLKYLLSQGADVNKGAEGEGTPLLVAARSGSTGVVEYLLSNGAKVNQVSRGEGTALIHAVRGRHYATAELLLENGADPYLDTPGNEYAMFHARRNGDKRMIQLLEKYSKEDRQD